MTVLMAAGGFACGLLVGYVFGRRSGYLDGHSDGEFFEWLSRRK